MRTETVNTKGFTKDHQIDPKLLKVAHEITEGSVNSSKTKHNANETYLKLMETLTEA